MVEDLWATGPLLAGGRILYVVVTNESGVFGSCYGVLTKWRVANVWLPELVQ